MAICTLDGAEDGVRGHSRCTRGHSRCTGKACTLSEGMYGLTGWQDAHCLGSWIVRLASLRGVEAAAGRDHLVQRACALASARAVLGDVHAVYSSTTCMSLCTAAVRPGAHATCLAQSGAGIGAITPSPLASTVPGRAVRRSLPCRARARGQTTPATRAWTSGHGAPSGACVSPVRPMDRSLTPLGRRTAHLRVCRPPVAPAPRKDASATRREARACAVRRVLDAQTLHDPYS